MESLASVVEQAKLNTSFAAGKSVALAAFKQSTLVGFNGGLFQITPELLGWLAVVGEGETVLIDSQQMPIKIPDVAAFRAMATSKLAEAVNEYYTRVEQLRKLRTTKQVASQ